MTTLSLKIHHLMELKNITEMELSKYIKIPYKEFNHFLSSKHPDKKILKKIANFFELSVDDLIQDNRMESIYISEGERYHDSPSSVLRYLMHDIGDISEGELFRRTGVPQPTIHRILSGATPNPRIDSIEPLAEFFNVTPDQMLGRIPLPKDRIPGTFIALNETKKIVPLLDWPEIASWPNILKNSNFKTNRTWITSESGIKGEAFAIKIINEDYLPEFRNGTIIIVDVTRIAKSGDFAVGVQNKNNIATLGRILIDNKTSIFIPLIGKYSELFIGRTVNLYGIVAEAKHHY
ncbi:MAG: helix-turn-helix domain-containing protein [Gammaproteobacteria bacterium]|nr:helix-turn-helix domain-containing protein [Gammaproteobacteria bacterium]